eukprot:3270049-Pyramimonas_sp.AAC.1
MEWVMSARILLASAGGTAWLRAALHWRPVISLSYLRRGGTRGSRGGHEGVTRGSRGGQNQVEIAKLLNAKKL